MNASSQLDPSRNSFLRGLLPDLNYRFVFGSLVPAAREAGERHNASLRASALLGEAMLGAFFLETGTSKGDALRTCLHLECTGPLRRVIAFAGVDGKVRSHAGFPAADWDGDLYEGKGSGQLKVSRWFSDSQVYTSSVEMRNLPLSQNLEDYMTRSDQIQAFVRLQSNVAADALTDCAGCMIQALPGATMKDTVRAVDWLDEVWPQLKTNFTVPAADSSRIFSTALRVLSVGQFQFFCDCSADRVKTCCVSWESKMLRICSRNRAPWKSGASSAADNTGMIKRSSRPCSGADQKVFPSLLEPISWTCD